MPDFKGRKYQVFVLGGARTGTSLAAWLLEFMGINMMGKKKTGEFAPDNACEDVNFITMTVKLSANITKKWLGKIKGYIDRRDKIATASWGAKSALAHRSIKEWLPYCSNPFLVYVFRDPYSASMSDILHKKKTYNKRVGLHQALDGKLSTSKMLAGMLKELKHVPTVITTFEEVKYHSLDFVGKVREAMDIEYTDEEMEGIKAKILEHILPDYRSWAKPIKEETKSEQDKRPTVSPSDSEEPDSGAGEKDTG